MSGLSVCFVVPTYNEAENIQLLIERIFQATLERADWQVQILVVDDQSPDGTGEIVADLAAEDPRILLLSAPKRGLGSAYARGFDYVANHLAVDVVVQMDADGSHNPKDCVQLVAQLQSDDGVQVVMGSRYVAGGGVDKSWGWHRRLISKLGNLAARFIVGMYHIKDCTSGVKAIRYDALRKVLPIAGAVQGYVFQVALLNALLLSGAKVVEHPIYFVDRQMGETKLGLRDVAEFLFQVWWLRLTSRNTFIKFGLVGLSGVFVNLAAFQFLLNMNWHSYLSSAVAIELSIVWNFWWNNYWTFAKRKLTSKKRIRGLKFNALSLVTLCVSVSSFVVLSEYVGVQPAVLAQAISIIPAAMANYFANSYWTFKSE